MHIVVVTDANIFLDLLEIDLIVQFFDLDLEISTTIEVLMELDPAQATLLHKYQSDDQLSVIVESSESIDLNFSRSFSEADISVLKATYALKAIALTGERRMRNWCTTHKLSCHGIIWIFDLLIEQAIIDHTQAIEKMEALLISNQWLPFGLCRKRIEEWERKRKLIS